jgi:uncharacterized membrane protein SpoIIM required for sporulation
MTDPNRPLLTALRTRFGARNAPIDAEIEAAALRSDRFRQAREPDWRRLDAIIRRMESGRLKRLSDEDVLDLPGLYRSAVSSLSIARATSLDAATLGWLEELVRRAWFQVYGPRQTLVDWLRNFFGGGWPAAVRAMWLDVWIALAVMVTGGVIGWLLVAGDPHWYGVLASMPAGDPRVPGASRAALRGVLFGHANENFLSTFAASLFGHNAQIAILAFALGFAFGIPSLMLLVQNTGNAGALVWLYHGQGLTWELLGWLAIHGTTELFAILLAGAAGLHIGRSMAFPGELSLLDAAAAAGRRAAVVMVGVVLMLLVAATLEGFARQLIENTGMRLAIGGSMLVLWLAFFYAPRGKQALVA